MARSPNNLQLQELAAAYDRAAESQVAQTRFGASAIFYEVLLNVISSWGLQGAKVIDLGCGVGNFAIPLAQAGAQVDGVDVSTRSLELARLRAEGSKVEIHFILGHAGSLDECESSSYDYALCLGPVYHVESVPYLHMILSEIYRVLRPSGVALISFGNAYPILSQAISDYPLTYIAEHLNAVKLEGHTLIRPLPGRTSTWVCTVECLEGLCAAHGMTVSQRIAPLGALGSPCHLDCLPNEILRTDGLQLALTSSNIPAYLAQAATAVIVVQKMP